MSPQTGALVFILLISLGMFRLVVSVTLILGLLESAAQGFNLFYHCVAVEKMQFCEQNQSSGQLSCSGGKTLYIYNAFAGAKRTVDGCNTKSNSFCWEAVTDDIKDVCEGESSCSFYTDGEEYDAVNADWQCSDLSGNFYIEVSYSCV
eukprot:sb/3473735/